MLWSPYHGAGAAFHNSGMGYMGAGNGDSLPLQIELKAISCVWNWCTRLTWEGGSEKSTEREADGAGAGLWSTTGYQEWVSFYGLFLRYAPKDLDARSLSWSPRYFRSKYVAMASQYEGGMKTYLPMHYDSAMEHSEPQEYIFMGSGLWDNLSIVEIELHYISFLRNVPKILDASKIFLVPKHFPK